MNHRTAESTYMGWHDPRKHTTPRSLVEGAVRRFERKHDTSPAMILHHPETAIDHEAAPGVQFVPNVLMPIGYLYVGPIESEYPNHRTHFG